MRCASWSLLMYKNHYDFCQIVTADRRADKHMAGLQSSKQQWIITPIEFDKPNVIISAWNIVSKRAPDPYHSCHQLRTCSSKTISYLTPLYLSVPTGTHPPLAADAVGREGVNGGRWSAAGVCCHTLCCHEFCRHPLCWGGICCHGIYWWRGYSLETLITAMAQWRSLTFAALWSNKDHVWGRAVRGVVDTSPVRGR